MTSGGIAKFELRKRRKRRRGGVVALDYVLVLGIVMPLIAFVFFVGPHVLSEVYQMICTLVAWPFM